MGSAKNPKKPKALSNIENGRLGGRPKGVVNKATHDIRMLARKYAPAALEELGRLSVEAQSERAKVAAIREILDRAYGKSAQPIEGDITLNVSLAAALDALKARRGG